jgi:hypothetical protein
MWVDCVRQAKRRNSVRTNLQIAPKDYAGAKRGQAEPRLVFPACTPDSRRFSRFASLSAAYAHMCVRNTWQTARKWVVNRAERWNLVHARIFHVNYVERQCFKQSGSGGGGRCSPSGKKEPAMLYELQIVWGSLSLWLCAGLEGVKWACRYVMRCCSLSVCGSLLAPAQAICH